MRLAVFQFAPVFGDAAANVARLAAAIERTGADLLVAPELATTGYLIADRDELARLAESIPGPTTDALARACGRANAGARVVVGLAERRGDRIYNAAALVAADGVAAVYRKVHLFDRERELFEPGPEPFGAHPIEPRPHRLGLLICFDWLFPEAARSLALDGATLLAHPSNLVLGHGQAAMATRALENGVFVATANRVGTETRAGRALTFTGRSQVVDPSGRVLAAASGDAEETLVVEVELDRALDKRITATNDRLADRRPECYRRG